MIKLLSILSFCLVFVSCSPDRVSIDELTNKGTAELPLMYYDGKLFNGIGFDFYSNGQLAEQNTYEDGKLNGTSRVWHENGQLWYQINYKNGKVNGAWKTWYENGQLKMQGPHINGKLNGLFQYWDENGQLIEQSNWKDGVQLN